MSKRLNDLLEILSALAILVVVTAVIAFGLGMWLDLLRDVFLVGWRLF